MGSTTYVRVMELDKSFGETQVLAGLALEIKKGEIFALLGPSGSGKTTALRLLAGFETPDGGSIEVGGEEVTHLPPAKRRFGMVFQHYALFPHLTVGENVAFGLDSTNPARQAQKVEHALQMVDLAGFENRPVSAISGGQQQRVAVARALAPEPRVLLLDEPLSNLDPALRERTRRGLRRIIEQVGITTVLVTHEQDEAFELGDRVGVLQDGRLQQVGAPEDLYQRPANRFVAEFVGRAAALPGTFAKVSGAENPAVVVVSTQGGQVRFPVAPVANGVELAQDSPVELVARPESLQLSLAGTPHSLPCQIIDRRFAGPLTYFTVTVSLIHPIAQEGSIEQEVEVATASASPLGRVEVGQAMGLSSGGQGPLPLAFPLASS